MSCERAEQASATAAADDDNVMLCEYQTPKLNVAVIMPTVHKQCEVDLNFKCSLQHV